MGFINYEVDGQVGIITINRPKALNALNSEVLKELDATIDAVDLDAIRCLILTGAGEKSFVAGADWNVPLRPGLSDGGCATVVRAGSAGPGCLGLR